MFGCYHSGNVLHECIDKWKDIGWRLLLFCGVICAAEEDTASVVGLVHALVLLVRIQEDIFPSLPRSLVGDSFFPRLTLNGEGLGRSDGTSGNCGHVDIFYGKIGPGGFLLAFIHLHYELRHVRRLPSSLRHGKKDVDGVGIVRDVAVVYKVVKKSLFRHTIKICVEIIEIAYPCLLYDREDK